MTLGYGAYGQVQVQNKSKRGFTINDTAQCLGFNGEASVCFEKLGGVSGLINGPLETLDWPMEKGQS
jgi:hypothetical protein